MRYDFEDSIGYWILLTSNVYQRALKEELAPHGITFRQAQVLGCLAIHGELSQVELAGRMFVEPPTLVGILDRMERDGWIQRSACTSDRRRKMIRATKEAEAVWEKIAACGRQVRSRATLGLSPEQLQTLDSLLERVRQNLEGALTQPAV